MCGFKVGDYDILVVIDVVGCGIDVKGIDFVVNYELSYTIENYIYRIGRIGRVGCKGIVVSFFMSDDCDIMYEFKEFFIESKNYVLDVLVNYEAARVKF